MLFTSANLSLSFGISNILQPVLPARGEYHVNMEGTEVPNPWRSSACDCTCVLEKRLSRDSLMLAMRIVLFLPMQSSLMSF